MSLKKLMCSRITVYSNLLLFQIILICNIAYCLGTGSIDVESPLPDSYMKSDNITLGFCEVNPYKTGCNIHNGIDILAPSGTSVYSMCDGDVFYDNTGADYWNSFLIIKHNCDGKTIYGYYGHVSRTIGSNSVDAGQKIATVRHDSSYTDHLHLSVNTQWVSSGWGYDCSCETAKAEGWKDPLTYLKFGGSSDDLPDLNVKRVEISPSGQNNWQHSITIQSGQSFKYDIEAKVENQGEGDTDDTIEVEYYISEDKDFDKDKDSRLGKDTIDKIKSGEDETEHLSSLQAPTNPGTYYIFIYIDYDKNEEHKSNNYSDSGDAEEYAVLTVGAAPVLSVTPTNYNVAASSGSQSFVVSNTGGGTLNWTAQVTGGGSWLRITSGSSGTNSGTIQCSFDKNTTTSERTGTIRVDGGGVTGSPIDLTIKQAAGVDITAVIAIINNIILSGDQLPNCPSCTGETVTVKDEVFYSGTDCKCVATKSLVIGPNVTIQKGAKATFQSPDTKVKSPIKMEEGSNVKILK